MKSGYAWLGVVLLSWAALAHAADDVVSIGEQACSGDQTTDTLGEVLELACDGVFTLTRVEIVSDKKVRLYGRDALVLKGEVTITSPRTELRSEGLLDLNEAHIQASGNLWVDAALPDTVAVPPGTRLEPAGGSISIPSDAIISVNGHLAPISSTRVGGDPLMLAGAEVRVLPSAIHGTVEAASTPAVTMSASSAPAGGSGGMGRFDLGALVLLAGVAWAKPKAPIH